MLFTSNYVRLFIIQPSAKHFHQVLCLTIHCYYSCLCYQYQIFTMTKSYLIFISLDATYDTRPRPMIFPPLLSKSVFFNCMTLFFTRSQYIHISSYCNSMSSLFAYVFVYCLSPSCHFINSSMAVHTERGK